MNQEKAEPKRRRKNLFKSTMLRADISHHAVIKMVLERTFGNRAWLELKECTSIAIWKRYTAKLLNAMQLAIEETIHIRDDGWFSEVSQRIEHGLEITKNAKSADELFSGLSATLIAIVFLQIGMLPDRSGLREVTLDRANWRLDRFRTVQYVQRSEQLEALFWSKQQKVLGVEKQMKVRDQYRTARTKIPYSKWCTEHQI